MRHGKKFNHLGRKNAHRGAMLSNMASSLIIHKRINTTVAKAKALRKYIEPILTKSKTDDTNSRRVVFSYLQNKVSVTELFNNVAEKISTRPGGYTRIIKMGTRLGDNAEMCMMELVDFNDLLISKESGKTKTRRSRRGGKAKAKTETAETQIVEEVENAAVDESSEEKVEAVAEESVDVRMEGEIVEDSAIKEDAPSKGEADSNDEKKD